MKVTKKWQLTHAPVISMHDQGLRGQDMSLGGGNCPPTTRALP